MRIRKWLLPLTAAVLAAALCTAVTAAEKEKDTKAQEKGFLEKDGELYYLDPESEDGILKDRLGVYLEGKYYRCDENGILTEVSEVEGLAGIQAEESGRDLKKAFDWSASLEYYTLLPEVFPGEERADIYASFGFDTGQGDCYVAAATFYWMAKVLGEENLEYVEGHVEGTEGQMLEHAWVEQKDGDTTWFYDPYNMYRGRTAWKFLYGTKGSSRYVDSHNHSIAGETPKE